MSPSVNVNDLTSMLALNAAMLYCSGVVANMWHNAAKRPSYCEIIKRGSVLFIACGEYVNVSFFPHLWRAEDKEESTLHLHLSGDSPPDGPIQIQHRGRQRQQEPSTVECARAGLPVSLCVGVHMDEVSDELRGGVRPAAQRQTAGCSSIPGLLPLWLFAYVHILLAPEGLYGKSCAPRGTGSALE